MEFSRQLPEVSLYPSWQYRCFKFMLGAYSMIYYFQLRPDTTALFSMNHIVAFLGMILSVGLIFNISPRIFALGLWLMWAAQVYINPMIVNVSTPFVGWLLLAIAVIPHRLSSWEMPREIYWGAWLLLGVNYSLSGCHKLGSAAWLGGAAIEDLLHHPMARLGWWRDMLLSMPAIFLKLTNGTVLIAEILALPLMLWRRTRMLIWFLLTAIQIGILLVLDFMLLSSAMLIFHFFIMDFRALKSLRERNIVKRIEAILRSYGVGDIKS